MGEIRKIGDVYYIEFYARGLLYSQVAGQDYTAAEKLLRDTEAKIAGGEALTVVRQIDLTAFFVQFLAYARQEFGPKSAERFENALGHFSGFLNAQYPQLKQLSQITPSVMENYKASHIKAKPALVNFTLLLVREVLEYGIKLGFINDNPTLHVRLLARPSKPRPVTARHRQAQELLSAGVCLGKAARLLNVSDLARMMYFSHLIPLQRHDIR